YFSVDSVYSFYVLGGSALHFEAKDLIGSQRYGFILLMGLWLVYSFRITARRYGFPKYAALLVILGGLYMTFSRAAIVALGCSLGIYALWNGGRFAGKPGIAAMAKGVAWIV